MTAYPPLLFRLIFQSYQFFQKRVLGEQAVFGHSRGVLSGSLERSVGDLPGASR